MFMLPNLYAVADLFGAEQAVDHALAAASWLYDGNTTEATYRRLLAGIEDGDPEILDALPYADLSGEWADRYSSHDLEVDLVRFFTDFDVVLDLREDCDELPALVECAVDAYERSFQDTVQAHLETVCRQALGL